MRLRTKPCWKDISKTREWNIKNHYFTLEQGTQDSLEHCPSLFHVIHGPFIIILFRLIMVIHIISEACAMIHNYKWKTKNGCTVPPHYNTPRYNAARNSVVPNTTWSSVASQTLQWPIVDLTWKSKTIWPHMQKLAQDMHISTIFDQSCCCHAIFCQIWRVCVKMQCYIGRSDFCICITFSQWKFLWSCVTEWHHSFTTW